ncbi:MAG: endonuclease [Gammaproteobacteria bacterium]|nr:endonuclease [Gammaproteobacteria bacterium]MCP5458732.1 endonuclease [Gammaproteobacteria bacterium]MCP5460079.1 endonuclease [Gammaproteobacteria bacterium]
MARRTTNKRSARVAKKKQQLRYSPVGIVVLLLSVVLGAFGIGLRTFPELASHLPPEVRELLATAAKYLPDKNSEHVSTSEPSQAAKASLPNTATSFSAAKRLLYEEIYRDHRITFYCGCRYDKARHVDLESCGVTPRKNATRAQRVEAEHVFPAHQFGNFRACWRDPVKVCGTKMSGRECCEKSDPVFIAAHNDLMNLYPAVGEVNGDRSNYNWGMIPGERRDYGRCDIEVDSSIRRAEPPDAVMGDIARVMFYMSDTYGFRLSQQDQQLYTAWSRQDPPDAWEIERDRRIKAIQGKGNRFIENYEVIFGKR